MFEHAKEFATYKYGDVVKVDSEGEFKQVVTLESGEVLTAKSVIIATGMIERVPDDVEGIRKFENKGVSYCAICDGPLFKGEEVAVIGGGNSAVEEAVYLASVASKVHVLIRRDVFRADKQAVDHLLEKENVIIHKETKAKSIIGENKVEGVIVTHDGKETTLDKVKALFPYIGLDAVTNFVSHLGITNENGYIETDEFMETKVKGIYAVGDVRDKHIRQISTAVSDGTIAGKMITNR